MSNCSRLLNSTKRIVGRDAASAIPSASWSSFFCALTYGRIYFGAIMAMRREQPPQLMGPATGFHHNHAGRKLFNIVDQRLEPHRTEYV